MKRIAWFGLSLCGVVSAVGMASYASESATPIFSTVPAPNGVVAADARFIMHLSSDATTSTCDIYATADENNVLTGLAYICSSHPEDFKRYTVDDLRTGVSFTKDTRGEADLSPLATFSASSNIVLATISAPTIDLKNGGDVNVHYLSNGITGSYKDYPIVLDPLGTSWALYSSDDDGHRHFDQIFLKKKTSFGQTIGVSCISVSLAPETPADCSQ